ncbi:hypothetical protein K503DRAFT_819061, partial [Rhizopogon vinicolor AM-OR11-026]
QFWETYEFVAEEVDSEFLERYNGDIDIIPTFVRFLPQNMAGLFSAVTTSFIIASQPNPQDTTNALLTQLILLTANGTSIPQSFTLAPRAGYSSSAVWSQSLAYASLLLSLLAAFGAILGKQWLGYYKSNRYGHGSLEERGRRRQQKMEALRTWYFDAVVQSFPALLQVSLFLFGASLSINMWSQQQTIARVIICMTAFGIMLYGFSVLASLMSSDCPFQTPVSVVMRLAWHVTEVRAEQLYDFCDFQYTPRYIRPGVAFIKLLLTGLASARSMLSALHRAIIHSVISSIRPLRSLLPAQPHAPASCDLEFGTLPSEAIEPYLPVISVSYEFPVISIASSDAPSVKWLLETSTDPNVFIAACHLVPEVEWPFDFDVSGIISLLHRTLGSCFDTKDRLLAPAKDRALACATALVHLSGREYLRLDGEYYSAAQCPSQPRYLHFWHLLSWESLDADYALKINLGQKWIADYTYRFFRDTPTLSSASDATLLWLSQVLPYVFLLHKDIDELAQMEDLAVSIISMLLEVKVPQKAPSAQVLANCTLLAGILLGLNVDKTVLVKVDKRYPITMFPVDAYLTTMQVLLLMSLLPNCSPVYKAVLMERIHNITLPEPRNVSHMPFVSLSSRARFHSMVPFSEQALLAAKKSSSTARWCPIAKARIQERRRDAYSRQELHYIPLSVSLKALSEASTSQTTPSYTGMGSLAGHMMLVHPTSSTGSSIISLNCESSRVMKWRMRLRMHS